jgi:Meiotically up-regulated gene 113
MGHVYLLKVDCHLRSGRSLVKIGLTDRPDVQQRIKENQQQWQSKRKRHITVLHTVEIADSKDLEGYLHNMFKAFRVDKAEIVKMFGGGEVSGDTEFFAVPKPVLERVRNHMDAYTIEKQFLSQYKKAPIETVQWNLWDAVLVVAAIVAVTVSVRVGFRLPKTPVQPATSTSRMYPTVPALPRSQDSPRS